MNPTEKKTTRTAPAAKKTPPKPAKAVETAGAPVVATETGPNALQRRRLMTGIVVSDKMNKTIVVKIDRRVRHGMYAKYVVKSRRYQAHDEKNEAKIGDLVCLIECRPMSKNKRWVLRQILRRANQSVIAAEANV